jgi:hypothetical protein
LAVVVGILALQFAIPAVLAGPTRNCVYINDSHYPFYSIQEAVDYARSGDTIWICEGTYYESVYVYKNLKIKGWTDDCNKVVIRPPFNGVQPSEEVTPEENGYYYYDGIDVYDTSYVVIKNLSVKGFPENGITTRYVSDVTIENVCVSGNGNEGIEVDYSDYTTICEVNAYENYDDGIEIGEGGVVLVCDTWSEANGDDGLDIDGACTVTVKDSCFKDNGQRDSTADGLDIDDVGYLNAVPVSTSELPETECGLVKLRRVWAEFNANDGLALECAGDVDILDGNFNMNGEDGLDIAGVNDLDIENINATFNGEDGLDIDVSGCELPGADDVRIHYAEFSFNGQEGLDIEFVDEMKITWVSANGNGEDGLDLDDAYLLDVYYAEFSENGTDGVDTDCVEYVYLDDVWANRNFDNGVEVNEDVDCFTDYVCIINSKMNHNGTYGIFITLVDYVKIRNTETRGNGVADRSINEGNGNGQL